MSERGASFLNIDLSRDHQKTCPKKEKHSKCDHVVNNIFIIVERHCSDSHPSQINERGWGVEKI